MTLAKFHPCCNQSRLPIKQLLVAIFRISEYVFKFKYNIIQYNSQKIFFPRPYKRRSANSDEDGDYGQTERVIVLESDQRIMLRSDHIILIAVDHW